MASMFKKKTGVKLELITDVHILLMIEKGIRGGICHAILRYAKANNKYMKDYNKDEEESFLQYDDANNLYGFAMIQQLPVNRFDWVEDLSKIDEDFIKNHDENSDKGYILQVDGEYPKNLHDLHSDLPFSPERMKINKCNKLVCNLYDKKSYVVHIKSLKPALNHGLIPEPNYHTTKWFSENLLAIEMKKTKVKMNKPVYLGLSILEISKT